ncbi:hypothetical protein B6G15_06800 [Salmonella enterica subsp. enterica serovar Rubislaw]|nr:hypothetical protein [Salmonella enterica subsp. enterica serovar Rubislaw]
MLTEKYDFRITDQMTIPLRPHWIANDSYREKCKMLVLNRSKGEIHKVDFSKVTDYIKEGDVICFNDSTFVDGIIFTLSNTNDSYRDNFIFDAVHQSVSCTTQLNFVLILSSM